MLERPNGHNTVGKEAAFYAVEARAELQRLIASAWHRRRLSVPLGAQPSPRQAETNEPPAQSCGAWALDPWTRNSEKLLTCRRRKEASCGPLPCSYRARHLFARKLRPIPLGDTAGRTRCHLPRSFGLQLHHNLTSDTSSEVSIARPRHHIQRKSLYMHH